MTHAVRFLILGTRKKGKYVQRKRHRTVDHRPKGKGVVYKLVRPDQKPTTDDDFDAVAACDQCHPVSKTKLTDNRRTS